METKTPLDLTVKKNVKDKLPPKKDIERWVRAALDRPAQICILFVGPRRGRELNFQYRHKPNATNVLTFDYAHSPQAVADIALCVPVIKKEAKDQGKTFRAHLAHLIVHGVMHAQGFDHDTVAKARKMEKLETDVMRALHFPDPYSDAAKAH